MPFISSEFKISIQKGSQLDVQKWLISLDFSKNGQDWWLYFISNFFEDTTMTNFAKTWKQNPLHIGLINVFATFSR